MPRPVQAGLLKGFAAANKLVYESNKKLGILNKAKQLRRFTIVPEIVPSTENSDCASSPLDCTFADRQLLLQQVTLLLLPTFPPSLPSRSFGTDLRDQECGDVTTCGRFFVLSAFIDVCVYVCVCGLQYAGAIESMYDSIETSDKSLPCKDMHPVEGRGVKGCESNEFASTSLFPASESTCERSAARNFTCAVPAPAPHFMVTMAKSANTHTATYK